MPHSVFHQWLENERRNKCLVRFGVSVYGRAQGAAKPQTLDAQILLDKFELLADGDFR